MSQRILVTGSSGVIGSALVNVLRRECVPTVSLDIKAAEPSQRGDIRDMVCLRRTLEGCSGVVHLAAVSRVATADRSPVECMFVNVLGTKTLLECLLSMKNRPWFLFASSREVYGRVNRFPVAETTPMDPVNIYGWTKMVGEWMVLSAERRGVRTAVVRMANVFGHTADHRDRFIPSMVRGTLEGTPLRVRGPERDFDFIHIDDVLSALVKIVRLLEQGEGSLPALNISTGRAIRLDRLARMVGQIAGRPIVIQEGPCGSNEASGFCGSNRKAREVLGWEPAIPLAEGVRRLVAEMSLRNDSPGWAQNGRQP